MPALVKVDLDELAQLVLKVELSLGLCSLLLLGVGDSSFAKGHSLASPVLPADQSHLHHLSMSLTNFSYLTFAQLLVKL